MNRLDQLQKAQAEIGQAIERMERAFQAIRFIEPDVADEIRATIGRTRDLEASLLDLEEAEKVIQ